jgi:PIN domain nuclease of toxin-antitoxin system
MGRYLLDTHTAIWFFNGDAKLSARAQQIIRDRSNPVYLSIGSAWEVAIKLGIGKLDIDGNTADFIHDAESNKITVFPIKPAHLSVLETLPMIHRDPFDRLLVATAIAEEMTIITTDENIPQYDVSYMW